jgi:hypothetical protein
MASRLIAATTRCSSQKVIVIVFILAALSLASILSTTKFSNGILWRNSTAKTCNKETANSSDFISMEEDSISNLTNNDVLPKNDSTTIQKPLIAFLHITKTAGSSIEEAALETDRSVFYMRSRTFSHLLVRDRTLFCVRCLVVHM